MNEFKTFNPNNIKGKSLMLDVVQGSMMMSDFVDEIKAWIIPKKE